MKYIIRYFLNHGLLVSILFFSIFALGTYKMLTAQKEGFPQVELNKVTVSTLFGGASAEDVELNVTTQLEQEIAEVDGLYEMMSTSRENFSSITIQVDEDADAYELREILNEINQAVDKTQDLPTDLDELPIVDLVSTGDRPIIAINMFGNHDSLRAILPMLERSIEVLPGVGGVDKIGYFDREIHIEIDPVKARDLQISLSDVLNAIEARNLRTTGGTLESYLNERTVVTLNKFSSPEQVEAVILRSGFRGDSVHVRDIARVVLREKDETLIVRNEGKPGMSLVIRKKGHADIISTIDGIKLFMEQQNLPEGIGYTYSNDQSATTRLRLQVLGGNALMGFALVSFILFLMLNGRAAFWTAMSVPFSLFGTFILLPNFGITINVISLAGFVLVLGLLVDDAIVVAEKITHYREKGLPPLEAALKGAVTMWKPVFVASITTILAFSPMFSIGGMPGKFAWAIPAVVIIALSVSLVESFIILPHHLAGGGSLIGKGKRKWVIQLEQLYGKMLENILHWRWLVLLLMLVLFVASVTLAKKQMKIVLFPQDGVETFYIKLEMPRGASLIATEKRLQSIEQYLSTLSKNELESYSTRVGTLSTEATRNRGDHSHWGVISVYLTGEAMRSRTADEIISEVRTANPIENDELLIFEKLRVGPAIGKPIELRISTNADVLRETTSNQALDFLRELPGVIDAETDNKPGKDQLVVDIDYSKLAQLGLTVKHVADALRVTYDGALVSSTTSVEETIDYRVIVAPEYRGKQDMLFQIPVTNKQGKVLNLKDVVKLREARGPLEFMHVDGVRTETISADIDTSITTVAKVKRQLLDKLSGTWLSSPQMQVTFAGEARETQKIFGSFLVAGIVALVSIFLVVTLLFNSLGQPFIVMATIPFAVIGVIWAFFAHGQPLSFFSTLGTLGLIGVVVNDTIIMVTEVNTELANNLRGNLVKTVVHAAKDRLRPVLLTTFTTVVGLLPTAYGIGGSDALIMPLTMAMAYGLMFGTIITLILTPSLLIVGHDVAHWLGRGTEHRRGRA